MPAPDSTVLGRPFTGAALDRVTLERKDPDWVAALARRPDARAVAAGRDGVLVDGDGTPALARLAIPADAGAEPILVGLDDGAGVFALDLDGDRGRAGAPALPGGGARDRVAGNGGARVVSLRDAGVQLPRSEAGLAGYVTALLNWHRRNRFCANCGAPTEITEAGYSRHCPRCGAHHFPRTDPTVIMTVEHDGRLLLGRRAGWPAGRLSVLAGFVAPGESAEEAVIREVQEESRIVVRDPVYVTSQPWPFPASLMLGFHAESAGGEPEASDGELEEVHWLGLDDVRRAARGERDDDDGWAVHGERAERVPFQLPGKVSIARFLIERWVELKGA